MREDPRSPLPLPRLRRPNTPPRGRGSGRRGHGRRPPAAPGAAHRTACRGRASPRAAATPPPPNPTGTRCPHGPGHNTAHPDHTRPGRLCRFLGQTPRPFDRKSGEEGDYVECDSEGWRKGNRAPSPAPAPPPSTGAVGGAVGRVRGAREERRPPVGPAAGGEHLRGVQRCGRLRTPSPRRSAATAAAFLSTGCFMDGSLPTQPPPPRDTRWAMALQRPAIRTEVRGTRLELQMGHRPKRTPRSDRPPHPPDGPMARRRTAAVKGLAPLRLRREPESFRIGWNPPVVSEGGEGLILHIANSVPSG